MKDPLSDTPIEVRRKQFELLRRLTSEQRLERAIDLTRTVRQLVLSDLRHRYPNAPEEEIRRRFIARVLTRDEVIRAYGFDPKEEYR